MSIYSELVRLGLEGRYAERANERPVSALVAELQSWRQLMESRRAGEYGVADGMADVVGHDVALALVCERLGVPHALADAAAPPTERARVLDALAHEGIDLVGHAS